LGYGWQAYATRPATQPSAWAKAAVRSLGEGRLFTQIRNMTYVYLIESVYAKNRHYVGVTEDLHRRLAAHNRCESPHTSKFAPWNLVAYFAFAQEQTARNFERYLKSGSGKAFLKRHFLTENPP
jgi:predicted GIY-YIG superfamily endonuclease